MMSHRVIKHSVNLNRRKMTNGISTYDRVADSLFCRLKNSCMVVYFYSKIVIFIVTNVKN